MTALRLLLALLVVALAGPLAAHETTRSYLSTERDGTEVTARLRLAFRDIEVVAWMDDDLDGRITWGEAKGRLDIVNAYAAARLSLEAGGPCPLRPVGAGAVESGGIGYLDLAFDATCPDGAAPLRVGTALFAEIDPGHRLFLTATDGARQASAMLGTTDAPAELAAGAGGGGVLVSYFRAGVEHLIEGADHLVFLLVLILPAVAASGELRGRVLGVLAAVTGFTLAHALTLTAAATDLLRPPSALIETLVAVSILVTAVDNLRPFIPGPRSAMAAFFGTIHGFGFATALSALPLDGTGFALALLGFNLGIETAQIAVVLLAMPALMMLGGGRWTLWIGSAAAAVLACAWLWQRLPGLAGLV